MSKILKKIEVTIRKTMFQSAGAKFITEAKALNTGDEIPVAITFKKSPKGVMAAYAGNDEIANVVSVSSGTVDDLESLSDFEAKITGITAIPNEMLVTVKVFAVAGKSVSKANDFSQFQEEIERIVSESILPQEDVERNINIMIANRFPVPMINMVLKGYREYTKPIHTTKVVYTDPNPKAKQSVLAKCTLNSLARCAVIFEGDKSVGKNVAGETLAMIMGMPYFCIGMSRKMSPDDVFGTKSTDNSAFDKMTMDLAYAKIALENGTDTSEETKNKAAQFELLKAQCASVNIVQDASDFVDWAIGGGVMMLNEMNMAEANFLSSIVNPITDNTGFLMVPGRGRVVINKDCVLLGSQNDKYVGTCQQNDATISRFGKIVFEAPKEIKNVLKANFVNTKVPEEYFDDLQKFYNILLQAVRDGDAGIHNSCLNIRGMVRAIKTTIMIDGFTSLKEQLIEHVINTCPDVERDVLIMHMNSCIRD